MMLEDQGRQVHCLLKIAKKAERRAAGSALGD